MFLVLSPGNMLRVEQVGDGRNVGRDLVEIIIVHAKSVSSGGSAVVGLGGMGSCKEIGARKVSKEL